MGYELEFDDIDYDNGYGVHNGTLVIDVSPVFTNETFDAHGPGGNLRLYGDSKALTDCEIDSGTIFLIGNNGDEIGEIELDSDEILRLICKDDIIEKLISVHYR